MNAKNSPLTIIQLNVNSLNRRKKRHDMEVFLNTVRPHIVLLNETKIKLVHKVHFKDYIFIRNDRTHNKGQEF